MNKGGIPTYIFYRALKKYNRNNYYLQLFLYIIFLGIYCGLNLTLKNTHYAYEQNNAIYNWLIDEEFVTTLNNGEFDGPVFKRTFKDIGNYEEFWQFMEGPLYGGVYVDKWYNGDEYENNHLFSLLQYNKVVGSIQLRQVRVKDKSCKISRYDNSEDKICFGFYNKENRYTDLFNNKKFNENLSLWPGNPSFYNNYERDGFIEYLPLNKTLANEKIKSLKKNKWLDRSTRAISINMNVFNKNTKLITIVRLQIEFLISGKVDSTYKLFTIPSDIYKNNFELRLTFEILFIILLAYYIFIEFKEMKHDQSIIMYFLNLWNIVECTNLILYVFTIGSYIYWISLEKTQFYKNVINKNKYIDIYDIAVWYNYINIMSAVNCCFGFIKIFKFLQMSKRMTILWDTLKYAMFDIIAMFLVFMLIVTGYAFMGHLVFGPSNNDFHSLTSSLSVLLRSLLGDFNYTIISKTNPMFAPLFYSSYVFIVVLVILNMFIAVVSDYFEKTREEEKIKGPFLEEDPLVSSIAEKVYYDSVEYYSMIKNKLSCSRNKKEIELRKMSSDNSEESNRKKLKRTKTLMEEKHSIRDKITKLIRKAEYKMRKNFKNRNIYERFMVFWDQMPLEKKMGTLNEKDLTLILNSDEYGKKLYYLYNKYLNYENINLNEMNHELLLKNLQKNLLKIEDKLDKLLGDDIKNELLLKNVEDNINELEQIKNIEKEIEIII